MSNATVHCTVQSHKFSTSRKFRRVYCQLISVESARLLVGVCDRFNAEHVLLMMCE